MLFTDVFSARAVAARHTNDVSNTIPFIGTMFFPERRRAGVDLKWLKTHKGIGVALKPSALDATATIRTRSGFKAITEQMPLFRESMIVKETDLAEIQRAQDSNDPYLMEVLENIYADADELIMGAQISAERMRMSLIAPENGEMKISIGMADNTVYNYEYDADGEWKKSHYMELTSTDMWDKYDSSTPLNDIQEAVEYLTGQGMIPTYAIMNSDTLKHLMRNEQLLKLNAIGRYGIDTGYLSKDKAKAIFKNETGLTILVYDKKYNDYDGSTHKYFPDGYVTIVGSDALGNTWCGVTPEERTLIGDSKYDVSVLDNGIAIATKPDYGPPVLYSTTASMIALPSFEGMDGVFTIKVK